MAGRALALLLILGLCAIIASGLWIAIALCAGGLVAMALKAAAPCGPVLATSIWQASISWDLTALPMFIWMGEILYRTRLAEDMFEGLAPWLQRPPGRLLHVNVVGCTIFAAVSGSSASMVVLTTSIIMPRVEKAGFDLIWFGIYLVIVVEMAQITPPVGFNLYVLQGMTGRDIFTLGLYALPLFVIMCLMVAILAVFPELALGLPKMMLEAK